MSSWIQFDTPEAAARFLETAARTQDNVLERIAAARAARSLPGYEYPELPTVEELREKMKRWPVHHQPVPTPPKRGKR